MRCFFSETLFLLGLGQEVGDRRLDNRIFTFLDIFLGHRNLICRIDTEFRMLLFTSSMGDAEKRTPQPLGNSELNGEATTASGAISHRRYIRHHAYFLHKIVGGAVAMTIR